MTHSKRSYDVSMQGLPLSLSGVRKIMNMMDWGDIGDFVSFGEVGRDQIDDASYYILIAPQNVVGSTILTNLGDMVYFLHPVNTSSLITGIAAIGHVEHAVSCIDLRCLLPSGSCAQRVPHRGKPYKET